MGCWPPSPASILNPIRPPFWETPLRFTQARKRSSYQSGDELMADYTVTKDIDKWTVGLGGYSGNQLSIDSGPGAAACATNGGCQVAIYGIGPLVGYNFWRCDRYG